VIGRLVAGVATATALFAVAAPGLAKTPVPQVSGPIPQSEASHAFGGAAYTLRPEDLSKQGYVEEEFLVSGKANIYDWAPAGSKNAAVVTTANAPYTTRILVRRPAPAAKFSGRVVVEMLNPSNLMDLNIGWALEHSEIVRNGDAWVGITAKPVAANTLKTFNPQRYAALDWGNPLPPSDPKNCAQRTGGDSTQATENGLIWDINRQVGAWLRSNDPKNPFRYGGKASRAKYLYGWGYSQTGGYLYTYINAVHPLANQADGKPIYDGYVVAQLTAPSPISQCGAALPQGDPRRVIGAVGVPVIHVMSQSDYLGFVALRRADSDTPADRYRHYDLAGAGHATPDELFFAARPVDIVKGNQPPPPVACNEGPRSRFPSAVPFDAILHNLEVWTEKGIAPPPSQLIEVKNGAPVLDAVGNVVGGVRSPYLDVPTSIWAGNSTGPSFCRIAGHETPLDKAKVKSLYPTHDAYVKAVQADVDKLVKDRVMMAADGVQLVDEAKAAAVP
jgi:hypothetical protein